MQCGLVWIGSCGVLFLYWVKCFVQGFVTGCVGLQLAGSSTVANSVVGVDGRCTDKERPLVLCFRLPKTGFPDSGFWISG